MKDTTFFGSAAWLDLGEKADEEIQSMQCVKTISRRSQPQHHYFQPARRRIDMPPTRIHYLNKIEILAHLLRM